MKILVAVKRVIDYNVQIRVKEDGSGVVTDAASEATIRTAYYAQQNTSDGSSAQTAAFSLFQIIVPHFGTFAGTFMIASLEYAGEFNGEVTYSITFESNFKFRFNFFISKRNIIVLNIITIYDSVTYYFLS